MKISHGMGIVIGLVAFAGLGYIVFRETTPPVLTVNSFNPADGTGTYEWAGSFGQISISGFTGPWGWSANWINFVAGTGWTFQLLKNGVVKRTIIVNNAGSYQG